MTSSQVRQSSLETTQYFYIKHILIAISDLFFTEELTTAFKQQPGIHSGSKQTRLYKVQERINPKADFCSDMGVVYNINRLECLSRSIHTQQTRA